MGLPPGHRFPASKYGLLRQALTDDVRFKLIPAPLATAADLNRAHAANYVDAFLSGEIDPAIMRRIGFPWSPQLVSRTRASVGGTLAAARAALESGMSGALAGGTHHAFHAEGSGFCVFNDIAVAIEWLRAAAGVSRFSVVDLDVHQGDGTARIFENDTNVFTLSLHGRNNFPFRKQTSSLDVALDDHTEDAEYLDALARALPQAFDHGPQFVFYQSGVDGLREDALGKLDLTQEGLAERDRMVFRACRRSGARFVITIGGGYADPISLTANAHAQTFRLAVEQSVE